MEEAERRSEEKCNEKLKWQDEALGDAGGNSFQIKPEKALSQNSHLRGCCIKNMSGWSFSSEYCQQKDVVGQSQNT